MGTCSSPDLSNATGALFYGSLHSSLCTMLLIHICEPYMVKSMDPYFIVTEWSALFFVVFVLLINMFLAKLTIAVPYKSYKQHMEKMLFKRLQKRKAALYAAFDILAADVQLVGEDDDELLRAVPTFLSKLTSSERRQLDGREHCIQARLVRPRGDVDYSHQAVVHFARCMDQSV